MTNIGSSDVDKYSNTSDVHRAQGTPQHGPHQSTSTSISAQHPANPLPTGSRRGVSERRQQPFPDDLQTSVRCGRRPTYIYDLQARSDVAEGRHRYMNCKRASDVAEGRHEYMISQYVGLRPRRTRVLCQQRTMWRKADIISILQNTSAFGHIGRGFCANSERCGRSRHKQMEFKSRRHSAPSDLGFDTDVRCGQRPTQID